MATRSSTSAVAGLAGRLPGVVPAGVVAAARHRSVFDDLVELGLGRGLLTAPTLGRVGGVLLRG